MDFSTNVTDILGNHTVKSDPESLTFSNLSQSKFELSDDTVDSRKKSFSSRDSINNKTRPEINNRSQSLRRIDLNEKSSFAESTREPFTSDKIKVN